jgi:asparagine synthase (glutamine-hydrolysing)
MCGLIGIASGRTVPDRSWLARGADAISHRGPDDHGEWWSADGRVGFAHRRLSIIDLSPLGHQPMRLVSRDLTIVFNGEIYNFAALRTELETRGHRFASRSDTEVVLAGYAEWSVDVVERLDGMFAFAIHDGRDGSVFLARDRAGEKPLFYTHSGGSLVFGSELKALLAFPGVKRQVSGEALDCYLSFGFVPGDRCILEEFRKLPPAHAMLFRPGKDSLKIWRYWDLPAAPAELSPADEVGLLADLEGLLEGAVRRQLVADVPVGVLLSGGVDSSLVTAMAVRSSARIRTFSVGFPGSASHDESHHARFVAAHLGTEHHELQADAVTADLLPKLARQFDEPVVDSSMLPTWLVTNLVRKHCTVALGGDGGDELFGGYRHYSRLLLMHRRFGVLPRHARRGLAAMASMLLPVGAPGRNYAAQLGFDFGTGLPILASYFDVEGRDRLFTGRGLQRWSAEDVFRSRVPHERDLLQRATRMDFTDYLPEDILVKVDRTSMLNSLELRAPLLARSVIEFAFGRVPSRLKVGAEGRKIMLQRLARKVLPPGFDTARKQGFSIPIKDWLRAGPFRELFWSTLLDPGCAFDRREVTKLLAAQDRGLVNGERLFALVLFELWRRTYGVDFVDEPRVA